MSASALMKKLYLCINENMDLGDAGVLGPLYNNTDSWYLVDAVPSISCSVYLIESSWRNVQVATNYY